MSKILSVVQNLRPFYWRGGFCLYVEFHGEGSASAACLFLFGGNNLDLVGCFARFFLNLCILRFFCSYSGVSPSILQASGYLTLGPYYNGQKFNYQLFSGTRWFSYKIWTKNSKTPMVVLFKNLWPFWNYNFKIQYKIPFFDFF